MASSPHCNTQSAYTHTHTSGQSLSVKATQLAQKTVLLSIQSFCELSSRRMMLFSVTNTGTFSIVKLETGSMKISTNSAPIHSIQILAREMDGQKKWIPEYYFIGPEMSFHENHTRPKWIKLSVHMTWGKKRENNTHVSLSHVHLCEYQDICVCVCVCRSETDPCPGQINKQLVGRMSKSILLVTFHSKWCNIKGMKYLWW